MFKTVQSFLTPSRKMFGLNEIFNRVEPEKLAAYGPDIACAEWLMRNGAYIRWKDVAEFETSYEFLPLSQPNDGTKYYIEEVKAAIASINSVGFHHFKNCHSINTMLFNKCYYFDDECINLLAKYQVHCLRNLTIAKCHEVTDKGIMSLQNLKLSLLKNLWLTMPDSSKKFSTVVSDLRKKMTHCNIKIIDGVS